MQVNFFDDHLRTDLFPLTLTRPCAELRCGILTIAEKWKHALGLTNVGYKTESYLKSVFPPINADLHINGRVLPNPELIETILRLQKGDYITFGDTTIAYHTAQENRLSYTSEITSVTRCHNLFTYANQEIKNDFELLTKDRMSQDLNESNMVIGDSPVFIEEGAEAYAAVFNTLDGPIYIGKDALVMEGALIRGPFALGESSTIKMGAKIYGGTSIGPHCKVGGEVSNSVLFGYSNKGHDGFLGNSVLGEWCNLGADTNTSNLKNNYDEVKLWNYNQEKFEKTGLQFCGLIMGDHSKTSINTMLNTGTVIGVSSNIFGSGFPRNFVPSFAWGGASGFSTYQIAKALVTSKLVYKRRKKEFGLDEEHVFEHLFAQESKFRIWENK